jgi:hypothetical protein
LEKGGEEGFYKEFLIFPSLICLFYYGLISKSKQSLHHAMNHVRFMIGPELNEVQDRMQGKP